MTGTDGQKHNNTSGRHSTLGSEGPEFWFNQVGVESLEKALYLFFLTALMCKISTQILAVKDLVIMLE